MSHVVDPTDELTDSSTHPAVSLVDVGRRFGEAVAVSSVSLDLAQGEFFALLGPSGCGKTTTLRMIGGFDLPTSGRVLLDGADVTLDPPHKRDVNTVFQSYALFPHMSVSDNVAFGLRRKGVGKSEAAGRAKEYLELVGLEGFGNRRPTQLSGGQQQRVALARALVNHPKVLLLDEPMGALDAKIRKSMQIELKRIQREVGITFLYVTHDQAEAMSMADRLAVMNGGRIEACDTPRRVYDRPGTRFVAEFLGICNLLPVTREADTYRLPDGSHLEVGKDGDTGASAYTLGIRPEKLDVVPVGTAGASSRVRATITEISYLGASTEAHLRTPWGSDLQVWKQNITAAAGTLERGDEVEVTWDTAESFLLPADEPDPGLRHDPELTAADAATSGASAGA